MNFSRIARFLQEREVYRLIVEELAFITYREVREFDFARAELPRAEPARDDLIAEPLAYSPMR